MDAPLAVRQSFSWGISAKFKVNTTRTKTHAEENTAVIPAKAGIHFSFFINEQDQDGFPLSRE